MPTVFDSDGKAAYVYNQANDTWYQVSGKTDVSGTFEWTGIHETSPCVLFRECRGLSLQNL
jgi:hypothetical protein